MPKQNSIDSEINSIVCCLDFLTNEAHKSKLAEVAGILQTTSQLITKKYKMRGNPDTESSGLIEAFKIVVRFMLIENKDEQEALVRKLSELDHSPLSEYVNRGNANA